MADGDGRGQMADGRGQMADGVVVLVDRESVLREVVAREFLTRSEAAIAGSGRFVVALPGGSVAAAFLPVLSALTIDWARVDIFWIDERAVPPDHPDSNYALASRLLLDVAGVPPARVHRMRGEIDDLDEAARLASDELRTIAGDPPQLDLALVGFGDDGHIASVFGGAALQPCQERVFGGAGLQPCPGRHHPYVVPVRDAPKPPSRRLTMTLPVLARARRVIVAGFGPSKSKVAYEALHGRSAVTPLGELLRCAPACMVLLDSPYSH